MFTFFMSRTSVIEFWFETTKRIYLRGAFWSATTTDPLLFLKQEVSALRVTTDPVLLLKQEVSPSRVMSVKSYVDLYIIVFSKYQIFGF